MLAIGMLTCIRKAFYLAGMHYGLDLTLANIRQDDLVVCDMISHADMLDVFQIESRAKMSILPRLRPKCFYDLVIEAAIVRPKPIQGNMSAVIVERHSADVMRESLSKLCKTF